jgi:hypothetical protein
MMLCKGSGVLIVLGAFKSERTLRTIAGIIKFAADIYQGEAFPTIIDYNDNYWHGTVNTDLVFWNLPADQR